MEKLIQTMDNYFDLSNAILHSAVYDYRKLQYKKKRDIDKYEKALTEYKIRDIERFFISYYGMTLSRNLGKDIVARLRKEFN